MKAFACLLLLSLAFAQAPDHTYSLVWKPKKGQAFRYAFSLDTSSGGFEISFRADLLLKVLSVAANGNYTTEARYEHSRMTVDGKAENVDEVEKPEIEKFNARGERIGSKANGADKGPFSEALGDITDFRPPDKPVRIGAKWMRQIPGDDKNETGPAKIEYTASGIERNGSGDMVKVSFTYAETQGDKPVKAQGAFYMDASDGSLVKMGAAVENLKLGEPAASAKIKIERRSLTAIRPRPDVAFD